MKFYSTSPWCKCLTQNGIADGEQEEADVGEEELEDDVADRSSFLDRDVELPGLWQRIHLGPEKEEPELHKSLRRSGPKRGPSFCRRRRCGRRVVIDFCRRTKSHFWVDSRHSNGRL